ncbi:RnfABCDGE type electron transport complex subunit D [Pseudanabaena sp. PCC 6802]|uniref:RnfABCDGE type electron transport complex subunit D n=1 Tax=Pseudanabaena sp. PCC 6802 TaxID=118173 RepID=UPI00034C2E1B|nr:RnfABCDGE type electron transport complex subunit D [Pseudanabaena sp. PCC 6802]
MLLHRKDARDDQILFLLAFLCLGIGTRDWTLHPETIAATFITCWLTQWLAQLGLQAMQWRTSVANSKTPWTKVLPQKFHWQFWQFNWRSATITALGLSLLLRSPHPQTMMLAACLAILSKFIFTANGKHWFNPGNFGIIAALCLTNDAWVSPGQWGDEIWYVLLFAGAGGLVLKRVGRWDTSVAFLGTFALLETIRNLYLGWTWDVLAHRLMSGSLLLFALFMITDPRSIPNARTARLIWAAAIAILTFILSNFFFITTAMFWALFMLSPLTIWLDRIWAERRFTWEMSADRNFSPPLSRLGGQV